MHSVFLQPLSLRKKCETRTLALITLKGYLGGGYGEVPGGGCYGECCHGEV
jgi:hypothetical protein